jgi:hypothetical protein
MDNTRALPQRAAARRWSRLLDGQRVWGSVDFWPARHGFRKYRLVVFPPGISPADRRFLRLWRGWPMWGAVLWLVCEIVLTQTLTAGPAMMWSTTLYLLAGALTFALAGEVRTRVRYLRVVLIDGYIDPYSASRFAEWKYLVALLTDADERVEQGVSTPVQHEVAWWQAYDRLAADG